MKGIEISKQYYLTYGKPMLEQQFPEVADRIAVGLAGEGSECFGFDDEISRDHDFDPGFCMWLTDEDERDFGFKLSRAYAKLPKEFMGVTRPALSPVGGNRRGVMTISSFYGKFLGQADAPENYGKWLRIPEYALAAASNGEIFEDKLGRFSQVREILKKGYPEDVRLKKLAARTALMAQSGQYNYGRCMDRGETGAAQLAIFEFVKNAVSAVYLLNNAFEPYYKWAYRGMRDLTLCADIEPALQFLTESGNSPSEASGKRAMIEDIASIFIEAYRDQGLTLATCNNLETHAYSVTDRIKDGELRNMHVMDGVN